MTYPTNMEPDVWRESRNKVHIIVGSWAGHQRLGADCVCEPEIVIPTSIPDARIYFHDVLKVNKHGAH